MSTRNKFRLIGMAATFIAVLVVCHLAYGTSIHVTSQFGATANAARLVHFADSTADSASWSSVTGIDTVITDLTAAMHTFVVEVQYNSGDSWVAQPVAYANLADSGRATVLPYIARHETADSSMTIVSEGSSVDTAKTGSTSGPGEVLDEGPYDSLVTVAYYTKYSASDDWSGGIILAINSILNSGITIDTVYTPDPPASSNLCTVWGYLKDPVTGSALYGAEVTVTPVGEVASKNQCDSTVAIASYAWDDVDTIGYFSFQIAKSYCLGSGGDSVQYELKVPTHPNLLATYRFYVPYDSSTFELGF